MASTTVLTTTVAAAICAPMLLVMRLDRLMEHLWRADATVAAVLGQHSAASPIWF